MTNDYTSHSSTISIYAKLTKLGDNGFWLRGRLYANPVVGKKVFMTKDVRNGTVVTPELFSTEEVTEVVTNDDGTFVISTVSNQYVLKILDN